MPFYKRLLLPSTIGAILITGNISPGCTSGSGDGGLGGSVLGTGNVADADKLLIVDCLLPGTIRQLGTRLTTLTARRAVKTSGQDCEQRGGEYVPANQANYASSLKVWQPLAEAGDVQAQTYVGEIYEKGMGTTPNYQQARSWYIKAADQGDARAKTNLGNMAEQGLSVAGGAAQAARLYSDASRLGAVYSATDQRPVSPPKPPNPVKAQAKQELEVAETKLDQKKQQVAELKQKQAPAVSGTAAEIKKQEEEVRKQEKRVKEAEEQVKKMEALADGSSEVKADSEDSSAVSGVNFGNYYAVVIGNSSYANFPSVATSVNDTQAVASVLKSRYGFNTVVLSDASRSKMLSALDSLRSRLNKEDNLLIYYAGLGKNVGGACYWLPVDAKQDSQNSWISNAQIANFVDAMQAKHILVVADSCYTGTLSANAIPRVPASGKESRQWYATVAKTKVRVVLTSGASQPMPSVANPKYSVFARAFLNALASSGSVVEGARIFRRVKTDGVNPPPKFAPIRFAGHESGDFVFLKGGRVALGDEQPGNDPQQRRSLDMYAVLEKSLSIAGQREG